MGLLSQEILHEIYFSSPRGRLQKHILFLATAKTSSTASFLCYFYFSHTYTRMSLGLT